MRRACSSEVSVCSCPRIAALQCSAAGTVEPALLDHARHSRRNEAVERVAGGGAGPDVRGSRIHWEQIDPRTQQTLTSLEQARRIAALAREKLAEEVVILDMRPECSFTDFFVIATGRNSRQTAAIWDEVHTRLKQDERLLPQSVAGTREGAWIVADYLDVVLHVFTPEARAFYRLEELWNDVPAVSVDAAAAG